MVPVLPVFTTVDAATDAQGPPEAHNASIFQRWQRFFGDEPCGDTGVGAYTLR